MDVRFSGASEHSVFIFSLISLVAFGVVMVYSSSYVYALEHYGDGYYFLKKHGVFLVLGYAAFMIGRYLPWVWLRELRFFIYAACLILLAAVWLPGLGLSSGGARRWISFGFFQLQPSALVKILWIVFLAGSFHKFLEQDENQGLSKPTLGLVILLIPVSILLLLQPDFGTMAILWGMTFIVAFLAGLSWLTSSALLLAAIPLGASLLVLAPYRMQRLLAFLDPWEDPLGRGFQIIQSLLAFHAGGVFGRGLGNSQAKLFFLPSAQNDFIFSVLGEELGFIGILLLLCIFMLFLWSGFRLAKMASSHFGALLSLGLTGLIGVQAFINMGVVLSLVPNKGITFPFLSYGGSSLLSFLFAAGLMSQVTKSDKKPSKKPAKNYTPSKKRNVLRQKRRRKPSLRGTSI